MLSFALRVIVIRQIEFDKLTSSILGRYFFPHLGIKYKAIELKFSRYMGT